MAHRDLVPPHGYVPPISAGYWLNVGLRVTLLVIRSAPLPRGQHLASVEAL